MQFLLGAEDDDEEHIPHDLFTEMDEICVKNGEDSEWRESARWERQSDMVVFHVHKARMSLQTAQTERHKHDPFYPNEKYIFAQYFTLRNCNPVIVLCHGRKS